MSRLGRDYLQVGMYTDIVFPECGVHFLAVNDGVDSMRGENEFAAIRNIFNEMFARDTSKKIKATWQNKGKSGERLCTIPPYGYLKDPNDKNKWIIDPEAAEVVRRLYAMTVEGKGPVEIARILHDEKVERPSYYLTKRGIVNYTKRDQSNPYAWSGSSIRNMLAKPEYMGQAV